ncbi:MAG TPA: hypothetical protein VGX50_07535 [Longimicrobium sp.]|jgi:hypothetical protein|nr:hypothetical protein [Longimicrobium sp.]
MRYTTTIAAALVLAAAYTTPAAAQTEVNSRSFAAAIAPLPAALTPDPVVAADDATGRISARRFLISTGVGALAGAGAGLVIGAITTDGCQDDEEWCILGWEEEVAIHGVAGAMVGAGIGAIYGLVSGPRRTDTRPTPVSVVPSTDGAVTVGVTLRH